MTKYCSEIKLLSEKLWIYMTQVFNYSLPVSEIGITNHLVFDIIDFYDRLGSNCEAYVLHAPNEFLRGADIDLFVENESGDYYHYILQAKVMDFKGKYLDIKKWTYNAQFQKLIKTSIDENASALYLLYNGKTRNSSSGNSSFGASVIEAKRIRKIRREQLISGYSRGEKILSFNLLFLNGLVPFDVLFCEGSEEISKPEVKKYEDIFKGYPYERISKDSKNMDDVELSPIEVNENKKIKNLAKYRFVIKRNLG